MLLSASLFSFNTVSIKVCCVVRGPVGRQCVMAEEKCGEGYPPHGGQEEKKEGKDET